MDETAAKRQYLHSLYYNTFGRDLAEEKIPDYEVPQGADPAQLLAEEESRIRALTEPQRPPWVPPIEIHESEDAVEILVALPGIPRSSVAVHHHGGSLVVSAERSISVSEGTAVTHSDFATGPVQRVVPLPPDAAQEGIEASHDDGVLKIVVKREAPEPPQQIKISG